MDFFQVWAWWYCEKDYSHLLQAYQNDLGIKLCLFAWFGLWKHGKTIRLGKESVLKLIVIKKNGFGWVAGSDANNVVAHMQSKNICYQEVRKASSPNYPTVNFLLALWQMASTP